MRIGEFILKLRMTSLDYHEHYYQLEEIYDNFGNIVNGINVHDYNTFFLNSEPCQTGCCLLCNKFCSKADLLFEDNCLKIAYNQKETILYWNGSSNLTENYQTVDVVKILNNNYLSVAHINIKNKNLANFFSKMKL